MTKALSLRTVGLIALMWITVGVIHGLSRFSDIVKYNLDVPFSVADIGYFVLSYAFWMLVTVGLLWIMRRPTFVFSPARLILLFVGVVVIWLPLYFSYDYGVGTLIEGGNWATWVNKLKATSGSVIFFYAVIYALTFAVCVGIAFASTARETRELNIHLAREQAETALELSEQQMQRMQSQLSPHFLFNCLSAISYLARRDDQQRLVDAIAKVGNLLRYTIDNASHRYVLLIDELAFVRDYLDLQNLRFSDRFVCEFEQRIDDSSAECPPFVLQPLLENAFRHSVERQADAASPVTIEVAVNANAQRIRLCVRNARARESEIATQAKQGTGLKNLRTRLEYTYGDEHQVMIDESADWFEVEIRLPSRMEPSGV